MNDIDFSANDLLEYAFPKLLRQNSGRLPVNKYLTLATKDFPECVKLAERQDFDTIISKTIKNNRKYLGQYTSVLQIWKQEKDSLQKATQMISYLKEEQLDVNELEWVLKEIFENDVNILQNTTSSIRTNIRRLIMIYDYLKWGK